MKKINKEKDKEQMVAKLMEIMYNYKGVEGLRSLAEFEHMVNFNSNSILLYQFGSLKDDKIPETSCREKANFALITEYDVIGISINETIMDNISELLNRTFNVCVEQAIEVVSRRFEKISDGEVKFNIKEIINTGDIILEVIDNNMNGIVFFAYFQKVNLERKELMPVEMCLTDHIMGVLENKEPEELIHFLETIINLIKLDSSASNKGTGKLEDLLGSLREFI